jgi:hypothetical protein
VWACDAWRGGVLFESRVISAIWLCSCRQWRKSDITATVMDLSRWIWILDLDLNLTDAVCEKNETSAEGKNACESLGLGQCACGRLGGNCRISSVPFNAWPITGRGVLRGEDLWVVVQGVASGWKSIMEIGDVKCRGDFLFRMGNCDVVDWLDSMEGLWTEAADCLPSCGDDLMRGLRRFGNIFCEHCAYMAGRCLFQVRNRHGQSICDNEVYFQLVTQFVNRYQSRWND